MKAPILAVLLAALGLGACIDFVEPDSLGLASPTRLLVTINVTTPATPCGDGTPAQAGQASICLDASLDPGIDRFGEYRRILNDTLWISGQAAIPVRVDADSVRHYRIGWGVDPARIADSSIAVVYPAVEGVAFPTPGFRWYAASRGDSATVPLTPDGDLRLRVTPPAGTPAPLPRTQNWSVDVFGSAAQLTVRGAGFPWPSFRIPASLLADLRGSPLAASLKFTQIMYPDPTDDLVLYVQMTQTLNWTVQRLPPIPVP